MLTVPSSYTLAALRSRPAGSIRSAILLLLLPMGLRGVEPAVTEVVGTVRDGLSITIRGSGFGDKSPVAPITFDNFENGVAGEYLQAHDARWLSYQGDGPGLVYDRSQPHAGLLALGQRNGNGTNFVSNYFTYSPASQQLFVSYWWKVVPINPGKTIIKMTRLNSSTEAGGGGVYNGAGNTTLGGTYDLGTNTGPYCAYNNGAEGEVSLTGDWETHVFEAPPNNTWVKIDSYKKLSTPGVADGELRYRVHTHEKSNARAMTRAAGYTFLLDTVLLGTMEGSEEDHDYWVYIDDVYIDHTQARVEISESPRWDDRVRSEMQLPHTLWNDGQVTVTVNRGSYAAGSTLYLYVVNKEGIANTMGYPIELDGISNHAPTAQALSVTTMMDTPQAITLVGSDADGDALTYAIVAHPVHGALSGSGASWTYTPAVGYTGTDHFTFTVNDGRVDSEEAMVSIGVTASGNTAPVVTAISANPSLVTGTSTSLSATASDDAGEAALTYTWSTTGPASVSFVPNASNAAKATTATFSRAGSYTMTVTVRDGGGLTAYRDVAVTVSATTTAVRVTPATVTMEAGGTTAFTAAVIDQFGDALADPPEVTWSVASGGSITAAGVFTAGSTPGSAHTVHATSGPHSGMAQVTVGTTGDSPNGSKSGVCGSGFLVGLILASFLLLGLRGTAQAARSDASV